MNWTAINIYNFNFCRFEELKEWFKEFCLKELKED